MWHILSKALICTGLLTSLASGERRIGLIVSAPPEMMRNGVFEEFQREVNRIVALPEARLVWRSSENTDSSETFDRLAVLRLRGPCEVDPTAPRGQGWALGLTHVSDGKILPFIEIHCSRVVGVLAHRLGERNPRLEAGIVGRAVARVAAHEIYHVLANSAAHDTEGLAKEALSFNDLYGYDARLSSKSLSAIVFSLRGGREAGAFTAAAKAR